MKSFFIHKNGRLKVGLITGMVLFLMLSVMGIFFQIQKPMNRAVVSIKHVFEPETVTAQHEDAKPFPVNNMAFNSDTVSEMNAADHKKTAESQKPPEEDNSKEKKEPVSVETETSTPETKSEAQKELQENKEKTVKADSGIRKTETGKGEKKDDPSNVTAQNKEAEQEAADKSTNREEPNKSGALASIEASDITETAENGLKQSEMMSISEKPINLKEEIFNEKIMNDGDVVPSVHEKTDTPKKAMQLKNPVRKYVSALSEDSAGESEKPEAVTVDSGTYQTVLKTWMKYGEKDGEIIENIPLRVLNLRECYSLFQMKPVLVRNKKFVDLEDGSIIPEASLDAYAKTVFIVDRPRTKWRDRLYDLSIGENEEIELRYYMYDFIKTAIYKRVHQAVMCARENDASLSGLSDQSFDVLGKAFVINKEGGGGFGVFVPLSIEIDDGRQYPVSFDCFADQADIGLLKEKGIL